MRILVIEDNSDIAANLGDYLEDRGHTVDFAADGVTGLHLAVVHDFDAIVLDLNLPGMDGLEVCRKLRNEARKQTPVLMLTARDTPGQQAGRLRLRRRRLPDQAVRAAGGGGTPQCLVAPRQRRADPGAGGGRAGIQPGHAGGAPRRQAAAAQSDRAEDPAVADGSLARPWSRARNWKPASGARNCPTPIRCACTSTACVRWWTSHSPRRSSRPAMESVIASRRPMAAATAAVRAGPSRRPRKLPAPAAQSHHPGRSCCSASD